MSDRGWIGVDLDGTLAEYHGWKGPNHIGKPIEAMVERVKLWLDEGKDVRIFTARVCRNNPDRHEARSAIKLWCFGVFGRELAVTSEKDYFMTELWDDRCVTLKLNTGEILTAGREE